LRKVARIAIVFGIIFFSAPYSAQADVTMSFVTCGNEDGTSREFHIGWDNRNSFFEGKGYIPRLFCEGGYAGDFHTYLSDNLASANVGYFNGEVPLEEPAPEPQPTETPTPEPSPEPIPEPTPTESATVETVTATSPQETTTAVETETATLETTTVVSDPIVEPTPPPVIAPEPAPTPAREPDPAPEIAPEPAPEPEPIPEIAPIPIPIEEPAPEPAPDPEPIPEVAPDPEPIPEVAPEPPAVEEEAPEPPAVEEKAPEPIKEIAPVAPEPAPIPEPSIQTPMTIGSVDLESLDPQQLVELDNGVVLTAEVVIALQVLENPGELLTAIFTDPAQTLTALMNVGADMSPIVREKAQKTILASVIAGGIATNAAVSAAAGYRRKP
jgi:hypothetical protein